MFVNRKIIYSQEETTQWDQIAMARYSLAIIRLMKLLSADNVSQKWYADDGNAIGKLSNLRTVLDQIVSSGKIVGYHGKTPICQLIVKDEKLGEAEKNFENRGITIKADAQVLDPIIGTESECKNSSNFKIMSKSKV